jgi:hypothetical protein
MLQIVGDDGTVGDTEEVMTLTKVTERAEDLGLSLAEGNALRAAAQQRIVEAQVDRWLERHRHCTISGRKLRCKGSYPITFRALFGDVRLKSPRYYLPRSGRPTVRRLSRRWRSCSPTMFAGAPVPRDPLGLARALCCSSRASGRCASCL